MNIKFLVPLGSAFFFMLVSLILCTRPSTRKPFINRNSKDHVGETLVTPPATSLPDLHLGISSHRREASPIVLTFADLLSTPPRQSLTTQPLR
ncbi:hypothetical protein CEP53_008367 [Fusarium sp. AF-6]|nr:hypothetical protein CEP53_008367 [Fusarium sp. AF-6]